MAANKLDPDTIARAAARARQDWDLSAADPWYPVKKGWVITLDEKPPPGVPAIRPLPAKEYLEAVTRLWQASPRFLLGKSRQLLISWLFAWLTEWDAIFHDGRHCIIQGKRLEDVDAASPHRIMGRARFIRQNLPAFLQPKVLGENVASESYENGSTMEAIPQGEDIVRGKVPSTMFMDEICFQESSEKNWNAANAAAHKLWGVSTPNGHEFMYRQGDQGRLWDNWREWPQVVPGLHSYLNSRGIQLAFLHYTADPDRCTIEYQKHAREGYTNIRDYMREHEGDFTLVTGLGVYSNEFRSQYHVIEKYVVDPTLPIYRGWDPGYNGQACSFFQVNHDGQLVWFDLVFQKAVPLGKVIQEAKKRTLWYLSEAVPILGLDGDFSRMEAAVMDYGDPAARQHNADGTTDVAEFSKFGIRLMSRPTTRRKLDLVENVRKLLLPRSDGKPGLLVAKNSPEMDYVIAGFAGSYHYNEPKEGKASKELPEKDGWNDHIFDSAQYAIDNISPIRFGSYEMEANADWWKSPDDIGVGQDTSIH